MNSDFDITSYFYDLPQELIAQTPAPARDISRLLVLHRDCGEIEHRRFQEIIHYLNAGDLLVVNNTRVFPARLQGRKETGGKVELFLLEFPRHLGTPLHASTPAEKEAVAECLIKCSKRPRPGSRLLFDANLTGTVAEYLENGKARIHLNYEGVLEEILDKNGRIPLPPYISRDREDDPGDRERYQTIFAASTGAVAAPTAGLHFSETLLAAIRKKGVRLATITLHVGYGTFAPVRVADIREHRIHEEYVEVTAETVARVKECREVGGRIWAVGTTTARTLEFAATDNGLIREVSGWCGLYIYPGYRFKVIDNLITNFHLPCSSLLFLVSAMTGREKLFAGYSEAIARNYRFFSYGDAMAIVP